MELFTDALEEAIDIAAKIDITFGIRNLKVFDKIRNFVLSGNFPISSDHSRTERVLTHLHLMDYHEDIIGLHKSIINAMRSKAFM